MYDHIMVPLDGSKLAESVLPHLEAISGGCKVNRITLIQVVEPLYIHGGVESRFGQEERKKLEEDATVVARNYLNGVLEQLKQKGIYADIEVLSGHGIDKLNEFVKENGVDLIIIATHGHSGLGQWLHGKMADRIIRTFRLPLLIIHPSN